MAFTLWFTGLPASGKTTLARLVYQRLTGNNIPAELLDSDDFVRHLGEYFDAGPRGREINTRCMAIVSRYLNRHNIISIAVSTSPRREHRLANHLLAGDCIEVYCRCPLEIAQKRDPMGLYRSAARGELKDFPGVGAPYEAPLSPPIVVDTANRTPADCLAEIMEYLVKYMENRF